MSNSEQRIKEQLEEASKSSKIYFCSLKEALIDSTLLSILRLGNSFFNYV